MLFSGITKNLPTLPWVGGDEGVGNVVETGSLVSRVETGQRVILTKRNLGTWRHYGIYNERDLHVISPKIPLADASMLSLVPCLAYRLLKDFRTLRPMQSVIQNAANSPCGQCVIQMCKAWGIDTFNIVASHYAFKDVKDYLLKIGATAVFTLEEAEELLAFTTSLSRPVLALNCLGGRYEDAMLKLLERCGDIVYYGCAYDLPMRKKNLRKDAKFHKFSLEAWKNSTTTVQHDVMLKEIMNLMVSGLLKPPMYIPVELKNYTHVMRETAHCEAFAISNYVFDFTI